MPALASAPARRQPVVIVGTGSVAAARAAKAATTSIPIVFRTFKVDPKDLAGL